MATLLQLIQKQAARHAEAPAILAPGRRPLSYGQLLNHVENTVATLNAFGIGRTDCVAVVIPDGPEMAAAFAAVASAATCAPINPAARRREFATTLSSLRATALVVRPGDASPAVDVARELGVRLLELHPLPASEAGLFVLRGDTRPPATRGGIADDDDAALALHTSGTTGRPRLVSLTHRHIAVSAHNIAAALELTPSDRCLNVMPMFHIHGLSTVYASLAAGASVVCTSGLSAAAFFDWIDDFHPTWYSAAPTIHQVILDLAIRHPERAARSALRFIRSASSAMPRRLMADIERVFRVPLIEAYGMTEAGPQIASNRLPPHVRKPGSVGRAAGPDIAIVNTAGHPLAPGEVGEIAIRGASVASDGWLRTGDSGFLDADGDLFITGRVDDVINRGGEKISPHEIDAILMDHDAVAQAVTFAAPHPTLGESVQAAIVMRQGAFTTAADIRTFAATHVSASKVPDRVLIVDAIPRGPTGKFVRRGLADQLGLRDPQADARTDAEAPGTPTEERIASILGDVLGLDRLGLQQSFFAAGGHSLTATQAMARVSEEFQIDLTNDTLFDHSTPAALASLLATRPGHSQVDPVPRRNADEPCALSLAQQRMWFLDQLSPGDPAYNMQLALHLVGPLDIATLERCLSEIRRRHETLRTTVQVVSDQPVQVIAEVQPLRLPVVNLSSLPLDERDAEMRRLAREEAATPFHLARGPLFRALAVRLDSTEHVLLLGMHHIVSDGWSMEVLRRELELLYAALSTGHASPLPELPIQYGDFAVWQRRSRQDAGTLDAQLAYWTKQLADLPPALNLPVDRPRHPVQYREGATVESTIARDVVGGLTALSRQADATLFMALLAAFTTLLQRYTGQDDLAVGTPSANRSRIDTEGLIGFFANTLVLRTDLSGDPSFREVLERVRTTTTGAYGNQDVPFEKIVERLHPTRDASRTPLVQVMFAFQNADSVNRRLAHSESALSIVPLTTEKTAAKFDITLYVTEADDGLRLSWLYDTALFDSDTVARMASHYATLLEGVVAVPDCRLSTLPLLSREERYARLEWPGAAEAPGPATLCLDQLFEEQCRRTPDAVAVCSGDEALTYGELDAHASRFARALTRRGVGPGTRVGLCLPRSTRMPIALLGVLKAGGAFVPLDVDGPAERLAFMLHDAQVSLLVTEGALRTRLASHGAPIVCMDDHGLDAGMSSALQTGITSADSLAYIVYTSGSVGQPKGVMITHGNVCHYLHAMQAALELTPQDRYLHTAPFAFSSSVRQFALPLSCGAAVVIASSDHLRDPRALFDVVQRQRVSVLDVVPSHWRACTQTLTALTPDERMTLIDNALRMILSASEALTSDVPETWRRTWPTPLRMFNMYGQTETTGIATIQSMSASHDRGRSTVAIGRPILHTRAYLLDAARRPVPVGVCGELWIGGATVGLGYVNQPALTAERFVSDPFREADTSRLYRTGDLARCLSDGTIEFLGRADHQIKIRGFRVEPQEIEAVLHAHPAVRDGAVVAVKDGPDRTRLVAYIAPAGARRAVHEHLEDRLPSYMMPAAIVELPELPMTPNGKVDRTALAARRWAPTSLRSVAVPGEPHTAAEQLLASIWAEVLGVGVVGRDDNFFDLGGDSILSVQMIERARHAGLQLRVEQLFRHQTVAGLAAAAASGPGQLHDRPTPTATTRDVQHRPAGAATRVTDEPSLRVTLESMRAYGIEALQRAGLSARDAEIMTDVQVEASLRGQRTHNVGAIPRYARRLTSGATNPRPQIRIAQETATSALVDGDNAPGQLVAMMAMDVAIGKARQSGVAVVGARRSNHFGAAGHYVWRAARANLIGLCTTNSALWLPPTGGVTPLFGTNPLGVGVVASRHHPLVLDVSMSVTAKGKVALHLAEGKPLLPGWILDRHGRPSIDPADLSAGLGVPIGGHKGYGLALVMELLAGVLTGAGFGSDHRRELMKIAGRPVDFGHFFMAIDPAVFMPLADFTARVDVLIDQVKAVPRADGVDEILVPGEAEMRAREQNLRAGLPLDRVTYQTLNKYREEAGLSAELDVVWEASA